MLTLHKLIDAIERTIHLALWPFQRFEAIIFHAMDAFGHYKPDLQTAIDED
ncbi:MAG: hypothetical protein ACREEM_04000 [Blastocatellia bacterium]